jgi:hypothetical protein
VRDAKTLIVCRHLIPGFSRRHLEASFLRLGLPNPVLSVVEFLLMNRCGFKTVRLFTLISSSVCYLSLTVRYWLPYSFVETGNVKKGGFFGSKKVVVERNVGEQNISVELKCVTLLFYLCQLQI